MWPFQKSTFLDMEDEAWQVETWGWFLNKFGGLDRWRETELITPSPKYFPPTDKKGEERAAHLFESVKDLAGMHDWPCELAAQPSRADLKVGDVVALKPINQPPAGTFRFEDNQAVISYEPSDISNPVALIATLIHELAHYRLAAVFGEIPGGAEVHEYTTDLLTVFLGFGLFSANSAFNFSQHHDTGSQGWQYSRRGYLGERGFIFGLAIFLELKQQSAETAAPYLKRHLNSDLRSALKYIRKNRLIEKMLINERKKPT
jgi:hypothetical protein